MRASDGDNEDILCMLTMGVHDDSFSPGVATAVAADCGTDHYCVWGYTEAGAEFCCSYPEADVIKVAIEGGPAPDTISFQYSSDDLDNVNTDLTDPMEGIADGHGNEDEIYGSRVVSSHYSDHLHGGTGADYIDGDAGPDWIYGDEDGDTLLGGDGNDNIDGGSESDTIRGQSGEDTIHGGEGQDFISGGYGKDEIHGDGDGDVICGDGGGSSGAHEMIYGNAGTSNTLWGGGSYDEIWGDPTDYDHCGSYLTQHDCDDTITSRPTECPAL